MISAHRSARLRSALDAYLDDPSAEDRFTDLISALSGRHLISFEDGNVVNPYLRGRLDAVKEMMTRSVVKTTDDHLEARAIFATALRNHLVDDHKALGTGSWPGFLKAKALHADLHEVVEAQDLTDVAPAPYVKTKEEPDHPVEGLRKAVRPDEGGSAVSAKLNEVAQAIKGESIQTSKGTLRRYRHAIQDTVNHRVLMPHSPQSRIKALLVGRVGLSPQDQERNFRQVIELTDEAREGNVKAQSCRAIAKRAIKVIDAREEEAQARRVAKKGSHANPISSWEDDAAPVAGASPTDW